MYWMWLFIALNEMLQYGSDAKKVHEDNLDAEEVGNLVGDDATESMTDVDILDDETENISDDETISLNDADDDLGVIDNEDDDLNIEELVHPCAYATCFCNNLLCFLFTYTLLPSNKM